MSKSDFEKFDEWVTKASFVLVGSCLAIVFLGALIRVFIDFIVDKIREPVRRELWQAQREVDILRKEIEANKIILGAYKHKIEYYEDFAEIAKSNLKIMPYMAGMISDIETYGLEQLAIKLDWGENKERAKKVKSIREIRKDAQEMIERHKWAQYQLEYLLELYPVLQDVIETEFNQLPIVEIKDVSELEEYDYARDYLSKEEYMQLTTTQRNQLALDRYVASHRKTKWQIGRDYELYCGYQYALKGYAIEYYGSFMGLEDLGRDLICKKKDAPTLIIQCKYWSQVKTIHEKHIMQLYGTMISYCIEHNLEENDVKGVLITNITLSDVAKQMAKRLNIETVESFPLKEYPRIKCNINTNAEGETTKIYHLPFDQQYDSTKIDKEGEFFALTVADAEEAGFRRAFKHFA